jgi:dipeptidyl aminopeptidase/acylaminoacyl peptidase
VLVDIIDAPPTPGVSLSPNNEWMLLLERPSLPPISELAEPELRIAGLRLSPQTNGRSRTSPSNGLKLVRIDDLEERPISGLPADPRIEYVRWSPDGSWISFTNTTDHGIGLWVVNVQTARAVELIEPAINTTLAGGPVWVADSRTLLVALVPESRGPAPERPSVPAGPTIQENIDKTAPARTYQDLLQDAYDESLFQYYATAQLATITIDGVLEQLGEPGIIADFTPSPNGEYILVETIHRPFSYLVPYYSFPTRVEVIDLTGAPVHLVADLPLQEEVPVAFGSVPTGPRNVSWRGDKPATLSWVEALDGGDAGRQAEERDLVMQHPSPFDGEPQPLVTLGYRLAGMSWGTDDLAIVAEMWWRTRQMRTWIVRPGRPGSEPDLLFERSYEDRYNDPGYPMMQQNDMGQYVLLTADGGRSLFLSGPGASPEGDQPFIDKFDLRNKQSERLFRSEAPYYEQPVEMLDERGRYILVRRESQQDPPNYFVRDLRSGDLRQITFFPDPTPQLAGMQKELITYPRSDGVELSGTLYLPPGYDAQRDGPLPMLMWAYPREFKSADAASQVAGSPYRFTRLSGWSTPLWLTLGYGVLDGPTMPIIGEGEAEPNDSYVEQLVASAEAAVDEVVRRGVAERGRIGIGGHSYGAFMTGNLLTHSDLFSAGIARSGAYNRSLTPFGFQAEERTFWEAPEVYFTMSPFMNADKMNEPILLIHGEMDNNSGTFPIQSERYYHALKGMGKTARLVMLPYESHGYSARESILHMLWEMEQWLDRYVKQAQPAAADVSEAGI